MIQGTCRYCEDYLIMNDDLECCNSKDELPSGRGRAFRIISKEKKVFVICPECANIIANISVNVGNAIANDMISKHEQSKHSEDKKSKSK